MKPHWTPVIVHLQRNVLFGTESYFFTSVSERAERLHFLFEEFEQKCSSPWWFECSDKFVLSKTYSFERLALSSQEPPLPPSLSLAFVSSPLYIIMPSLIAVQLEKKTEYLINKLCLLRAFEFLSRRMYRCTRACSSGELQCGARKNVVFTSFPLSFSCIWFPGGLIVFLFHAVINNFSDHCVQWPDLLACGQIIWSGASLCCPGS